MYTGGAGWRDGRRRRGGRSDGRGKGGGAALKERRRDAFEGRRWFVWGFIKTPLDLESAYTAFEGEKIHSKR